MPSTSKRWSLALLGWGASAALLAACNALSGLDDDYVLDDGTLVPDDPPLDGSGSSSGSSGSLDGDRPEDAAPEAAVPDASPGDAGVCPPSADWCVNWDDLDRAADGQEVVGGTLTVDPNQGVGGSKALHAHANAVAMSRRIVRWWTLGTSFPAGKRYWLSFSFRLENVGVDYGVLGAIQANNTTQSNTEYGLASYGSCPGPCLDENNPAEEGAHPFTDKATFQTGKWYRAEVSVERSTGGLYSGTVKVDGVPVDSNGQIYFGSPAEPTKLEVGLGFFYTAENAAAADVFIDDVAAGQSP